MAEPRDLDLAEMARLLQSGALSSEDIVRSCLEAVDFYNDKLNAFISLDREQVIESARAVDRAPKEGLLSGIPVAIKDIVDVSGTVTTAGSEFFRNNPPAAGDAVIAARIKGQGGIMFGKTNLHEFAWGGTSENPHYGTCYNPWSPAHVAGGSSGGSAIAVATRMAPAALGTDTLGSIRHPSSFCGTAGLKPTFGILPTGGVFPLAHCLDHVGPMARSVADVSYLFRALVESRTRKALEARHDTSARLTEGKSRRLEGIRAGIVKPYVSREACHEAVWAGFEKALSILEDEGAEVVDVEFPEFEAAYGAGLVLTLAQASQIHQKRMAENPDLFGEDVRMLLEAGFLVPATDYIQAQKVRARLIDSAQKLMAETDCWIMPTTPAPATPAGEPNMAVAQFTAPIDTLGFPAAAFPSGLTDAGLPVSVQIIGAPLTDYRVLDIAGIVSGRIGFAGFSGSI
jgi:aspartyl-tRNA(Asn)/glutamyl-tRNA(Gln) amidotransferase subunit A